MLSPLWLAGPNERRRSVFETANKYYSVSFQSSIVSGSIFSGNFRVGEHKCQNSRITRSWWKSQKTPHFCRSAKRSHNELKMDGSNGINGLKAPQSKSIFKHNTCIGHFLEFRKLFSKDSNAKWCKNVGISKFSQFLVCFYDNNQTVERIT